MKRTKFIQHLNSNNCGFLKHGAKHDKYMNHINGKRTMIPRHPDIDSDLCALICKQLEIPKPLDRYPLTQTTFAAPTMILQL